ncbi:hypothetical protein JCM9957A_25450 [Kineosporia succinea]
MISALGNMPYGGYSPAGANLRAVEADCDSAYAAFWGRFRSSPRKRQERRASGWGTRGAPASVTAT